MTAIAHLVDALDDLEAFRAGILRRDYDLNDARSALAALRVCLLRAHRRDLALLLSEGACGGPRMLRAIDATIDALRGEVLVAA